MDSQDYLNQIAASARPKAPPKKGVGGILSSKYFKWGMIALGAFVLIAIVGGVLMMNRGTTTEEKCVNLKLRLDQTNVVISEYQQYVKSSSLRSLSVSLKGIFTSTSSKLASFMTSAYGLEERNIDKAAEEEAKLTADGLSSELFAAKINGLLDRTFAHKMSLEIYSVMGEEMTIYNSTSDTETALREILSSSYDSLNNLYTQFNDFSETNK